jgi:sec-independent protein translocase protein TatC
MSLHTIALHKSERAIVNQHRFVRAVTTHLKVSFWIGNCFFYSFALYELTNLFYPALKKQEQVWGVKVCCICPANVFNGDSFRIFYYSANYHSFLGTYSVSSQVLNQINLSSYISTLMGLILSTGIAFELPVVIYYLSKWGLVTPPMISHYRRLPLWEFL